VLLSALKRIREGENMHSILNKIIREKWVKEDSTAVFVIKDCILIQNFTGKNYTYRVVNYVTGQQKYLFYRRHKLGEDDSKQVMETIKALPFYNMKQAANGIEMIDCIFREIFPKYGFTIREEQVDLSKHMYGSIRDGKIALSDIAVGLGKTYAYLVAALVHRIFSQKGRFHVQKPIVITTSSIELQRSIIHDYIPKISSMLMENGIIGSPITCVLRKGKENYLCEKRLKQYYHSLDSKRKRPSEYQALKKLLDNGRIDLGDVNEISGYDKRKICVHGSECMMCTQFKICTYQRFMKQARKSHYHFQICNHNYYLADLRKRRLNQRELLPDYQLTIVDEAHKLSDAASQIYGTILIENTIHRLMKGMVQKSNMVKETISTNQMLFDALKESIPNEAYSDETEKFPVIMSPIIKAMINKLISNLQTIQKKTGPSNRQLSYEFSEALKHLRVLLVQDNIYWMENPRSKGQRTLASVPKNLSKVLGYDLWQGNHPMILTSGTLALDMDFTYTKRQLGMEGLSDWKIQELTKTSPFDFQKNCLLYINGQIAYPNMDNPTYIQEVSQEVMRLIKASNGHALVLFTSYKPLRLVFQKVREELQDYELLEMIRGKTKILNRFKESQNAVLFATGSMWEGVNIPGDRLSHLIIVKLPFPIPDPISDYERDLFPDMKEYLDEVLVPKMLIKLRQGVGRLIRSESDTGVISILDVRASDNGRYYQDVLHALPKCRRAENVKEIQVFLKGKKEASYFE